MEIGQSGNLVVVQMSRDVWDDYLDPSTSSMESELGLPQPQHRKGVVTYEAPPRVAMELAGYLGDRGGTLLGQSGEDASNRRAHREAVKIANAIEEEVRASRKRGTLLKNSSSNQPVKGSTSMPKVTRKASAKTAAKPAAKAANAVKEAPAKTRRSQEDVDALVPEFLEQIREGATLRALKQEFGFSDDGPIRAALYRAGFDRKGEEHGEEAESIDAKKAAGKKQVVKLRESEGAAWYRLAFLTGLSEPEVKAIVADAGGPTGRVYREPAPKPEPKPRAAKGTKAKAKAVAADPSNQD